MAGCMLGITTHGRMPVTEMKWKVQSVSQSQSMILLTLDCFLFPSIENGLFLSSSSHKIDFEAVETQPTKVDTILSIMTGPFSLVFKLWQLASLTLSS